MIVKRAELGTAIRRLRVIRGLNLTDVADGAGTDAANISRVERGKQGYSHELLMAVAGVLGVRLSELFREAESLAGHHVKEERAGYAVALPKSLRRLNEWYMRTSPAARELVDALIARSAAGTLHDEVCQSLLTLLRPAAAPAPKTKAKPKKAKPGA